ncbi:hypothetical protein ACHAW6_003979 [Cyclotella cf. meneghiniana]
MGGYRPQLHKLDNESSYDVKTFICKNNTSFQYPLNQRSQTCHPLLKESFCHHACQHCQIIPPLQLMQRPRMTDITHNMICPCTQNPNLSAHEALEGLFLFDEIQMTQIRTK